MIGKLLLVTREDALASLRKYLAPMFELNCSLVAVTPLNKVDDVAGSFTGSEVVKEDELNKVFPPLCIALEKMANDQDQPKKKLKKTTGGGGVSTLFIDWTNVRACDCPKCERPNAYRGFN